jgi:UPF0716 family protein affecting phage T7 exclusion
MDTVTMDFLIAARAAAAVLWGAITATLVATSGLPRALLGVIILLPAKRLIFRRLQKILRRSATRRKSPHLPKTILPLVIARPVSKRIASDR